MRSLSCSVALLTVLMTVAPVTSALAASFCGRADLTNSVVTFGSYVVARRSLTMTSSMGNTMYGIVGCSMGMNYGAVTMCTRHSAGSISAWRFSAAVMTSVTTLGTMDLCKWSCTNGGATPCIITTNMVDALPVELLSFGAE